MLLDDDKIITDAIDEKVYGEWRDTVLLEILKNAYQRHMIVSQQLNKSVHELDLIEIELDVIFEDHIKQVPVYMYLRDYLRGNIDMNLKRIKYQIVLKMTEDNDDEFYGNLAAAVNRFDGIRWTVREHKE